jgi:hypothetical protein
MFPLSKEVIYSDDNNPPVHDGTYRVTLTNPVKSHEREKYRILITPNGSLVTQIVNQVMVPNSSKTFTGF